MTGEAQAFNSVRDSGSRKGPLHLMTTPNQRRRIIPAEFDDGWLLEVDGDLQSHVDLHDPSLLRFEYLRRIGNVLDTCWPPAQPIRVLHLGAGALTLARYVQATRPGSEQIAVELDAELIDLVTAALPLEPDANVHVIIGDARTTLQEMDDKNFEVIVVDIFTGPDTATHLCDYEFYREVLQRLSAQGVLVVNIGDEEGLEFFYQQAQVLHNAAITSGLNGAWTLADASTLDRKLAGNAVLAAGSGLPTGGDEQATLRSQLAAAGPFPAAVLTPAETASLTNISADDE